ncbi:MAG: preprotein translocase subunit SecY [Clostridiales bacterium]|jgi:preprotein translocase subunit SecY|nr:preprotein translocase subunit SecY [Clostridiales bacterium]
MLKILANAWKVPEIRKKLFYILLILAIYRLGNYILLPGVDMVSYFASRQTADAAQSFFNAIAGGGFASVFVLGIGPYITSSIIMQLLTVAIPKLEQIQKEGEEGRKKINQYTRVVAVFLSLLQASGTVYTYNSYGLFTHRNFLVYGMAVLALVAGSIFIMWLGELLTEKGIGNGSSFIIFANILSGLPSAVSFFVIEGGTDVWKWILNVVVLALFVLVMALVVWVQGGERRIPVQYSKKMVGRQMYGGQSSFIPIKVNIAGVMSIIFAISLLQFPSVIANFWRTDWLDAVVRNLEISAPIGGTLYVVLIFFFTFFYTSFAINPIEMAENMKKSGGFIPGIRPGKPTSDYIQKIIERLSWAGALFYAIIAMIPVLFQVVLGINVGFGGTTLLIVTGVALELVKQLESQLLMRHYKGFLS